MQSKRIIGIILVVALALSAAIFIFFLENMENTDKNDTVHESDVTDRVAAYEAASEQLEGIMRNNSERLNSIGGYTYVIYTFNKTGESTAYINGSGGQLYSVLIDTPNGTIKSVEKVDRLPEWAQIKTEVIGYTSSGRIISESEAAEIALDRFQDLTEVETKVRLTSVNLDGGVGVQNLAWIVEVRGTTKDGLVRGGEVLVDAVSGEILSSDPC